MKTLVLALAMGTAVPSFSQAPWKGGTIPMVFSRTEVGHALRAIGLRTGVDVIYAAGKEKLDVTLNVTAASPEEAIRSVASAAGLVVRRAGRAFVVAPPAGMRGALEPYAASASLPVDALAAAGLASGLQEALPYASVRMAGDRLTVLGLPEDIEAARTLLAGLQAAAISGRSVSDVVVLGRAVPGVVAPLIEGLYPDVKVVPTAGDRAGGALALSGPAASVEAARAAAGRLDREMATDGTIFRVYDLRYASAGSVLDFLKASAPNVEAFAGPAAFLPPRAAFNPITAGVTGVVGTSTTGTSALGTGTSTATPTTSPATTSTVDRAKTLVLRGRASDVDAAVALLAQLDRKPRQVVVEVNVFETSPERDESVGLTYEWSTLSFSESGGTRRSAGIGSFGRTPFDFNLTLNAMVVRKEAKILARPSIRVVDDGQASVFIGDTLRARIVTGGALGSQNVEIREFPVGIILLLAPHVNADGNITLHVNPVVSTVSSVGADNIPQTSAREAETTAIVKDGETVVLGGLIRDEDVRTIQEVPILSKLPLVGELFRNRARNHRRRDILVSITPHIVADDEPATKAEVKP